MMAIAETVKSTLGPKGMAKMIVDSVGDITITNDGAEILKKLDIHFFVDYYKILIELVF